MPTYSQYITNIPDNQTIISSSGKLAVNSELSTGYDSYGNETNKFITRAGVPLGGVIGVCISLTGCPSVLGNFQLCNGGAISDTDSPFNGQNTPDLITANRFIRFNSTSGGTGGTATIGNHTHGLNTNVQTHVDQTAKLGSTTSVTDSNGGHDNQPPYYDLAPYIRIK